MASNKDFMMRSLVVLLTACIVLIIVGNFTISMTQARNPPDVVVVHIDDAETYMLNHTLRYLQEQHRRAIQLATNIGASMHNQSRGYINARHIEGLIRDVFAQLEQVQERQSERMCNTHGEIEY